jgi:hypothetical protein
VSGLRVVGLDGVEVVYSFEGDRLLEVLGLFRARVDPRATAEQVRWVLCNPWNSQVEGHQDWLDSAGLAELVDFVDWLWDDTGHGAL